MISWKKRFRKKKKLFVFTPSFVTGQIKCETANTVAFEDIVYVIPNGPNTLFRNPLLIAQLDSMTIFHFIFVDTRGWHS